MDGHQRAQVKTLYTPAELAWARRRPIEHQTPLPQVGDEVMYRHDEWGPVEHAEVLSIQPLDDQTDPNLWDIQLAGGVLMQHEGRYILRPCVDPWPLLWLHTEHHGRGQSREARLRGAAGWLPLDWELRFRPEPELTTLFGTPPR